MGYANSGLGSADLIMKKRNIDLGELSDITAGYSTSDMGYVMFCTVGVMILTPGIGMFYGGALKRKNMLQILLQSFLTTSVITLQWFLFGYSLAVSPSSSAVMGNFRLGALMNLDAGPFVEGGSIPSIIYFTFSVFFPIATVQIFVGAISERSTLLPSLIVGFIWCTVCYCPFAYAVWCANGWLYKLGSLDFAGGGPVHIASGAASLSYSWFVGPRKFWKDPKTGKDHRPRNSAVTFAGVAIIWCTWLCFNSGTLLSVNVRTGYIMANTQIAASSACFAFTIVDYILEGKWSLVAASEGAVVGLVNITPSCGFYTPYWACITSIVVAVACRLCYNFNEWVHIDDTTHSWVVHGLGGIFGSICLGIFASPTIAGLDGVTEIDGGWIYHNWAQMGYQFAAFTSTTVWSFVATYIICWIVDKIPGCKIRANPEAETMGMDYYEMYEQDGLPDDDLEEELKGTVTYISGVATGTAEGQVPSSSSITSPDSKVNHRMKTEELV